MQHCMGLKFTRRNGINPFRLDLKMPIWTFPSYFRFKKWWTMLNKSIFGCPNQFLGIFIKIHFSFYTFFNTVLITTKTKNDNILIKLNYTLLITKLAYLICGTFHLCLKRKEKNDSQWSCTIYWIVSMSSVGYYISAALSIIYLTCCSQFTQWLFSNPKIVEHRKSGGDIVI